MNREQLEEIRARAAEYGRLLGADVEDGVLAGEVAGDVPALLDEIDRLNTTLAAARRAKRGLFARLIASAHLLDVAFTNAPEQSPWTKLKPDMHALSAALRDAEGSAEGGTSKGSEVTP